MYPQDPDDRYQMPQNQPTQLPVDYLNQIAPQTVAKRPNPFQFRGLRLILLIGVILCVLVGFTVIAMGAVNGSKKDPIETLTARLKTTDKIVGDSQSKLKSSQLRSINSSLKIFLANTNRDIVEPLKNQGVDAGKLSASITAAENGEAITERLEDARLNATFDRTYAREMAYQLETTLALMRQIYSSTKSVSLKTFLETAFTNLEPTQKAFAEFNAANG